MDIHSSAGLIRAGHYGELSLVGHHEFERGVRFATLRLRGSVSMPECTGDTMVCAAGRIRCEGDMRITTLMGHGDIEIAGNLHCRSINFTGRISVGSALMCEEALEHIGLLLSSTNVRATRIHIQGVIRTGDMHASEAEIRPLSSTMHIGQYLSQYHETSEIGAITAGHVLAQNLRCHCIDADHVRLEYCHIGQVTYHNTYRADRNSKVARIIWKRADPITYRRRA